MAFLTAGAQAESASVSRNRAVHHNAKQVYSLMPSNSTVRLLIGLHGIIADRIRSRQMYSLRLTARDTESSPVKFIKLSATNDIEAIELGKAKIADEKP